MTLATRSKPSLSRLPDSILTSSRSVSMTAGLSFCAADQVGSCGAASADAATIAVAARILALMRLFSPCTGRNTTRRSYADPAEPTTERHDEFDDSSRTALETSLH